MTHAAGRRAVRRRAALSVAVLLAAMSIRAQPAHAGFRICNQSDLTIETAYGYNDGRRGWVAEGWWKVAPSKCVELTHRDLSTRYYYVYARDTDGGRLAEWEGDTPFCVDHKAFTLYQARYGKNNEADCARAGLESLEFFKVDTEDATDWTLKLTKNGPVASGPGAVPPAPQLQPQRPNQNPVTPPQTAPGGGNAGTACQRYPNLC